MSGNVAVTPHSGPGEVVGTEAEQTGQGVRWLAELKRGVPPREEQPPAEGGGHGGHGGHGSHGGGDGHHGGASPFRRLLKLMAPDGRDIGTILVFAVGVGILSLATPITVEELVTTVNAGPQMKQQVLVLALILLFCLGLAAGLRALKALVVECIQQRIFVRVVGDLSYRLPRVSLQAFDRHHGPELVNRFFDVLTVQKAAATLLLDGVIVVIQALIGLAIVAVYHPYLLAFDLALLAALAFIVFGLGRGAVRTSIEESILKYEVAGWLQEMARHPLTFKHGSGQDHAVAQADALTGLYLRARQDHFRILFRQIWTSLGLQAVASAALLGLGGWLVIPDETGKSSLDIGQLVAAELIVVVIVGSFVKLGKSLENVYDLLAAMDKLGHLLDLPLERAGGERHVAEGPAAVRVHEVGYEYDDDLRRGEVLTRTSFALAPGERVALVGPSGAGKSTLVELLYGLRAPRRGRIELDGVDLRDLSLESLREQVAMVAGIEIFEGSILDNVRMGRQHLSPAEVRSALARVGLLDEVQRMPEGLRTQLSTGGSPLALGQIRRLMLARAIVGQPRLLILDETLDEQDRGSRQGVLDEIFRRDNPWTLLTVTHNDEVAARCDRSVELARAAE